MVGDGVGDATRDCTGFGDKHIRAMVGVKSGDRQGVELGMGSDIRLGLCIGQDLGF